MGIDEKTRIVEVFNSSGHVYASANGYMSIRVYTKDQACADFIARKFDVECRRHKMIFEISVTGKKPMVRTAMMLLDCPDLSSQKRDMLRIVVKYVRANTKQDRFDIVSLFRHRYYSNSAKTRQTKED